MAGTFDHVYDRYGRQVYAYLVRMTGNAWSAEELCQETFVRYLAHEPQASTLNGSLAPWLYRVATNLAIDRLRKRRPQTLPGPEGVADTDAGTSDGRDLEARIRAEVGLLPPDLRATFLLRAHHGQTYRQVGEALGISERAAKDRFRRTRDRLARRLAHLLEEPR